MNIRKFLFTVKLSLGLVLCFVVVRTVIMPHHPAEIFVPASAVSTENVSANRVKKSVEVSVEDYSAIVERNIFGSTDSLRADRPAKSVEKELNLALVGTVCGSTGVSRALIQDNKTKRLELYKTGQSVAGACIKSIEEDAVILLHNGRRKILKLNRTGGHNTNNMRVPSSQIIRKADKVVKPVESVKQPLTQNVTQISYVEAILTKAVIEPYTVNGQVEGLRITGLENIPMAKILGLKDGDVISVVNGHQLTSKQKALQVFKKARSQATMSIEILRGDETKELSFDLR